MPKVQPSKYMLLRSRNGDARRLQRSISKAGRAEWQRKRVLAAVDETWGLTPLHVACAHRNGGAGETGWLGCIAVLLRTISVDGVGGVDDDGASCGADAAETKAWVNTLTNRCHVNALHSACTDIFADPESEAQRLAAVAALLAYDCDATQRDKPLPDFAWLHGGRTPREYLAVDIAIGGHAVAALLELAERVGGPRAVWRTLVASPETLTTAPGWDVVASLPRVRALIDTPSTARLLIAEWGVARALRATEGAAPREGSAELDVFGKLPRQALAEVLLQVYTRVAPPPPMLVAYGDAGDAGRGDEA